MINEYNHQAEANIQCLLEDIEYCERKNALLTLIENFEKRDIKWSLACSANLFLRGVVDEFHDFDFIVDRESIETIKQTMKELNAKLVGTGGNGYCESDVYLHYQFGRIDVDIISVFRVITFGSYFEYPFNENELDVLELDGRKIWLSSMEAQYLLYAMMEGWQARRRFKRVLIEEYLKSEGLKFPEILQRATNTNLPPWIRKKAKEIIGLH